MCVWNFNTDGDAEGWTGTSGFSSMAVVGGSWTASTTSTSAYVTGPDNLHLSAAKQHSLYLRIRFTPGAVSAGRLRWITETDATWNSTKQMTLPQPAADGQWHVYQVRVGQSAAWSGYVRRLRLYPCATSSVQVRIDHILICDEMDRTFYMMPICDNLGGSYSAGVAMVNDLKARLGDGTYGHTGYSDVVRYMSETTGVDSDYQFSDSHLQWSFQVAIDTNTRFIIMLNGGQWASPSPLMQYLMSDPNRCMWNHANVPYPYGTDGDLNLTMGKYAATYRYYKERNLKQCVQKIVDFLNGPHGHLLVGVTTDSELSMSSHAYHDYNPLVIQEFRDWERGAGAYSGAPRYENIQAFNSAFGKSFASWDQVDPPRYNDGSAYWREWTDFRCLMVDNIVQDMVNWIHEAGMPADKIFSHQMPNVIWNQPAHDIVCSPLTTAQVTNGHLGITAYVSVAADAQIFAECKQLDSNWGIFEYNPISSDYNTNIHSLEQTRKHCVHILTPYHWANAGSFTVKGSVFETAIKDFISQRKEEPYVPSPWNVSVARSGSGRLTLTWTNPANSCYAFTRVYRSSQQGDLGVLVADNVTAAQIEDTGLDVGRTYYYTVRGVEVTGVESPNTDQHSAIATGPQPLPVFSAVAGLTDVTLSWTAPNDPDHAGVRIVVRTNGMPGSPDDGELVYQADETPGAQGQIVLTNLARGVEYYYAAFSYDALHRYSEGAFASARTGDHTPPTVPVVSAELLSIQTDRLSASWFSEDPECGIGEYEYAIGTTPGDADVQRWVSNENHTSVTAFVPLTGGRIYYFAVRAKNNDGFWSSPGVSKGTGIVQAIGINEARTQPNGVVVGIPLAVSTVTLGEMGLTLYCQAEDRSCGIKVALAGSSLPVSDGDRVAVLGTMETVSYERQLGSAQVIATSTGPPAWPLTMNNASVSGAGFGPYVQGATGALGANNIGLLVRTTGIVRRRDPASYVMYVDDGSGLWDGSGYAGLRVYTYTAGNPIPLPQVGQRVVVTGISSLRPFGSKTIRMLKLRRASDIVVLP